MIAPRLVKVVKEMGLVCVSYGAINNEPEKVKLQVQEGIDAVIVDSVLAIRKGLTGSTGDDSLGKAKDDGAVDAGNATATAGANGESNVVGEGESQLPSVMNGVATR